MTEQVATESTDEALRRRVEALEQRCGGLLLMGEQSAEASEAGHKRLRGDIRENKILIESNFDHFDTVTGLLKAQVASLQAQAGQPVDATRLTLSTRSIIGLVIAALSLAGWIYGNNASVKAELAAVRADLKDSGKTQDSSLRLEIAGVRSDLKDVASAQKEIGNRIDAQKDTAAAAIKAQDAQLTALKESIALTQRQSEQAQRQGELLRFEFQTLKDTVLGKKSGGEVQ